MSKKRQRSSRQHSLFGALASFGRTSSRSGGQRGGGAKPRGRAARSFERLEDRHVMSAASLLPNDPYLLDYQWHVVNTGQEVGDRTLQDIFATVGEDARVLQAWLGGGYTGQGIVIGMVDNGVQLNHPDLQANISTLLGAGIDANGNLIDVSIDPNAGGVILVDPATGTAFLDPATGLPFTNAARATAMAGIIGAVANNGEGIAGVAYNSTLVPIRVFNQDPNALPSAEVLRQAILYGIVENAATGAPSIDIYVHSWKNDDDTRVTNGPTNGAANNPDDNVLDALRDSVLYGREGLGAIHIFQAGSGGNPGFPLAFGGGGVWDFAGYDGFANSRYAISVTGVDHDGFYNNFDGTWTAYPEVSAATFVSAPTGSNSYSVIGESALGSGIWTTDLIASLDDPNRFDIEGYNLPADPFTGLEFDIDNFEDPAYTSRFTGANASSAIVAGVIAMMLEADETANGFQTLTTRDIQEILIRSARQNAAFEQPVQGGTVIGPYKNLWQVNSMKQFRLPETPTPSYGPGGGNRLLFDVDNAATPPAIISNGLLSGGQSLLYYPLLDIGGHADAFSAFVNSTFGADVTQYTTGAGYTVSQGVGAYGSMVGYAHGVIDAGLAVQLASQWYQLGESRGSQLDEVSFTSFVDIIGAAINPVNIGSQASGFFTQPGILGGGGGNGPWFNQYDRNIVQPDTGPVTGPFQGTGLPNQFGVTDVTFEVPGPNTMEVEWVELKVDMSGAAGANLDKMRVTLISPNGTVSELNHVFDFVQPNASTQNGDFYTPLLGEPGFNVDPDGGNFVWTFSTNRSWGERSDGAYEINPVTGEPYAFIDPFSDTASSPISQGWRVRVENYGGASELNSYELTWHGARPELAATQSDPSLFLDNNADGAIDYSDTFRIQGFVGEDEDANGLFNFDRTYLAYNDAGSLPLDLQGRFVSGIVEDGRYERLGEIERLLDRSFGESFPGANDGVRPENFLENVIIKIELDTGSGPRIFIDQFVTGDDGNYYFDVPLLADPTHEYVVTVVDAEGRDLLDDMNNPSDRLQKYKSEWRIDNNWFTVWDHDRISFDTSAAVGLNQFGQAVMTVNPAFNTPLDAQPDIVFDMVNTTPLVPSASVANFVMDPKVHYDIFTDNNGVPVGLPYTEGVQPNHIRGINFLVKSEAPAVNVEGSVFRDIAANGVLDAGQDQPFAGIEVYVDVNNNGLDPTDPRATTDASGNYSIANVPLGVGGFSVLTVAVNPASVPAGFTYTNPVGGSQQVPAVLGFDAGSVDFLIAPPITDPSVLGNVTGLVFNDLNNNGAKDTGEPGIAGFTVTIGALTAVSGADGSYTINAVPATTQQVSLTVLPGFVQTTPAGGGTQTVAVPRAGTVTAGPFGVRAPDQLGSASGVVFNDANGDGVRNPAETGKAGVLVYVDSNGNQRYDAELEPASTTNASGAFSFPNLPVGPNAVRLVPGPTLIQTLPNGGGAITVDVQNGAPVTGVEFGVADALTFSRDFGDLGLGYPTLLAEGGPWHIVIPGTYLGAGVTTETEGILPPDEDEDDGVTLLGPDQNLTPGTVERFRITGRGNGAVLNVWIDFNADRVFTESERVVFNLDPPSSTALDEFDISIDVAIPSMASTSPVGAMFRWGPEFTGPTGGSFIGEVETYLYNNSAPIVSLALAMGDFDASGWVDQGDYAMWRSSFGSQSDLRADGNGDGVVDIADYTVWRDHYGMQVPAVGATEPLEDPALLYYASYGSGGWAVSGPAGALAAPALGAAAFFLVDDDTPQAAVVPQPAASSDYYDDDLDLALESLASPSADGDSDFDLFESDSEAEEDLPEGALALAFEELLLA